MNCAPILITTLNRHEHFIRLIESLRKNTWAKYTPVYVALDFPPSEKYVDGYIKICDYLKGDFSDFLEFHIIRRNENYGSLRNMAEMRDKILQRYDTFIRTDDDAEFSPNFLEFMNKCLEKYKDCDDVIAVTGYSYPIKWTASPESNVLPINFNASMWGTGFWKHKYLKMKEDIDRLEKAGVKIPENGKPISFRGLGGPLSDVIYYKPTIKDTVFYWGALVITVLSTVFTLFWYML